MILTDLRYGLRSILRHPSFAAIAIVTLALGIGANTAIFTVVDRVVLRAVPFPEPDRLVVVWETNPTLPVPVMVARLPHCTIGKHGTGRSRLSVRSSGAV